MQRKENEVVASERKKQWELFIPLLIVALLANMALFCELTARIFDVGIITDPSQDLEATTRVYISPEVQGIHIWDCHWDVELLSVITSRGTPHLNTEFATSLPNTPQEIIEAVKHNRWPQPCPPRQPATTP